MAYQSRSHWRTALVAAALVLLSVAGLIAVLLGRLSPLSQRWVVHALSQYYGNYVTLETFQVTLFPHIVARGTGLVLRDRSNASGPPLASIKEFSMEATLGGLLLHPRRVRRVQLEGLTINVSPRPNQGEPIVKKKHRLPPIYFENIEASTAVLNTFSKDPEKLPRVFAISKLRLQSVGVGKAMSFQASLTNPKPIGQIQTTGKFGPWNPDDPGATPVAGQYDFRDADLSTIRGIAGMLSSEGTFQGVLERLEVDGSTRTPEFSLGVGRHSEPLQTQFHAVVDGLTGQTLLEPVRAVLGQSLIMARGGVLRAASTPGTTIQLDVTTDRARLGDLLALAVRSARPPMEGEITIHTRFEVLPGTEEVEKRLRLKGQFNIDTARFTDRGVEEKVTHLSERGQGKPGEVDGSRVASNFKGHFELSRDLMSFSSLSFDVPGAAVDLNGTYGLQSEELNFLGTLQLQAELSQTTTGIKSKLLKAVDPLFKGKDAGTVVPIRISGTRDHPAFKVRYHELLKRFGL